MAVKIKEVERGSLSHRYGIKAGDMLVSINGGEIYDMMDLQFYSVDLNLEMSLERDGRPFTVKMEKEDEYRPLGLEFETYLIDKQHSCKNKCIFCFVDQLPKGLREELYFKDDDERLSFLYGNYITLTNLSRREIDRIKKIKISPINISVHTVDEALRVSMMKNPAAADINRLMDEFARAGIVMNTQVVLCKNINDGRRLERTVSRMHRLYPRVQSCSIVPVGVTRYRQGLPRVETFDREDCRRVIEQVESLTRNFYKEKGVRVVYLSDEFYIKAGMELPPAEYYGDFPQIENGVGMVRTFLDNFDARLKDMPSDPPALKADMAVGEAMYPIMKDCLKKLYTLSEGKVEVTLHCIKNRFFGGNVWVTGLITGTDLAQQLKGRLSTEKLLLCRDMLRARGDLFLDDYTPRRLQKELGATIRFYPNNGWELARRLTGMGDIPI